MIGTLMPNIDVRLPLNLMPITEKKYRDLSTYKPSVSLKQTWRLSGFTDLEHSAGPLRLPSVRDMSTYGALAGKSGSLVAGFLSQLGCLAKDSG